MIKGIFQQQRNRLAFIVGLVILAVVGVVLGSRHGGQEPVNKSLTDALKVVNTTVANGWVKISIQNVSRKNVNGIQLSVNESVYQIEFLDADEPSHQVLQPGTNYEQWFSLGNASTLREVAVLAVTFDDNRGDGDARLVKEITDTRRGVKKQLTRFGLSLKEALRSSDANSSAIFETLKSKINDLPDDDGNGSGAMRMGQHIAKQRMNYEIDKAKGLMRTEGVTGQVSEALAEIDRRNDERIRTLP